MRAILFAAKSTQDVRGSIPGQLADCRAMADREGWEIVREYHDEAASAWKGNRGPGLEAAMAAAAEAAPCILLAQHSDRFARGDGKQARHLAALYFWALETGVELRSVEDDSTFTNPLLAVAMGERNAEDSRRKSLAVAAGMKRRAQRGQYNGPRPLGYRWERDPDGDDRRLVIDEPEAVIVRRIFAEYVAGRGQREIARSLIADGLTAQRGGTWHQGTIAKILASEVYAGRVRFNDEVYEGEHEAIVDPAVWEKARQLREALKRTPGKGRGRYPTGHYLFRKGHLRCGICGDAMIPTTKDGGYEAYACFGRLRLGVDHCPQRPVRRALVDGKVWEFFERVALDLDATRAAITEQTGAKLAELDALRAQAEHEAAKVGRSLAKIKRDYLEGDLNASDWKAFHDDLTAELEAARAQVERLDAQREQMAGEAAAIDVEDAVMRELTLIRAAVVGEAQASERAGLDAFRAALVRLFARFEVVRFPDFGFGGPEGTVVYQGATPAVERDGEALFLLPYVRREAIDWHSPEPEFPALRRVALATATNDASGLQM